MERLAKGQFWEGNSSVGHVKLKLCAKLSDGAAREADSVGEKYSVLLFFLSWQYTYLLKNLHLVENFFNKYCL